MVFREYKFGYNNSLLLIPNQKSMSSRASNRARCPCSCLCGSSIEEINPEFGNTSYTSRYRNYSTKKRICIGANPVQIRCKSGAKSENIKSAQKKKSALVLRAKFWTQSSSATYPPQYLESLSRALRSASSKLLARILISGKPPPKIIQIIALAPFICSAASSAHFPPACSPRMLQFPF